MFERFTDRARRVVVMAQEEARQLRHNYIGPEHILLGLIKENDGVAAEALKSLGIDLAALREQVLVVVPAGEHEFGASGHIPFTPVAKKSLELSLREALQLGHNYIGTEHVLLGLVREGDNPAAAVLAGFGADLNRLRRQVALTLREYQGEPARPGTGTGGGFPGLHAQLAELAARVDSLQAEVSRLRGLLREHGIDPGEDAPAAG